MLWYKNNSSLTSTEKKGKRMKKIIICITAMLGMIIITTFGAIKISPIIDRCIPCKDVKDVTETKCHILSYKYSTYVSWYGKKFHGRKMANGRVYNMYDPSTAAHKTLPFGKKIKLTNPENGQSIIVVIKDRGPYIIGRHFDLSYAAARKLGIVEKGVEMVKIEILTKSEFYFYRIKKGETLWRLFGEKWTKIAKINNISPERITKGMKIIVPYKF